MARLGIWRIGSFVVALAALVVAGVALVLGLRAIQTLDRAEALRLLPYLHFVADNRPGAGFRVENAGNGPALIRSVALALPKTDGTGLTWMAYPDPGNGPTLNVSAFLGLEAAVAALPDGVGIGFFSPPAGMLQRPGTGFDLLRFPAPASLPADWTSRHAAQSDQVLAGLMVCIRYVGIDGRAYAMDYRGLCSHSPAEGDTRFTGRP